MWMSGTSNAGRIRYPTHSQRRTCSAKRGTRATHSARARAKWMPPAGGAPVGQQLPDPGLPRPRAGAVSHPTRPPRKSRPESADREVPDPMHASPQCPANAATRKSDHESERRAPVCDASPPHQSPAPPYPPACPPSPAPHSTGTPRRDPPRSPPTVSRHHPHQCPCHSNRSPRRSPPTARPVTHVPAAAVAGHAREGVVVARLGAGIPAVQAAAAELGTHDRVQ